MWKFKNSGIWNSEIGVCVPLAVAHIYKYRILRNLAFRVHSKKGHEHYEPLIAIPKLLDEDVESTYSDAFVMNMNIDNTIEVLEEETDTLAAAVDNTSVGMEIVSNLDPEPPQEDTATSCSVSRSSNYYIHTNQAGKDNTSLIDVRDTCEDAYIGAP